MNLCQTMAAKYFPASAQDTAQAVCECESSGNQNAHCLNCAGVSEDSRGLWQINVNAHPDWAGQNLYDPDINAQAALAISNNGTNWNPWSTFTSGCYLQYLTGAPVANAGGSSVPVYATFRPAPATPAMSSTEIGVLTLAGILLLLDLVAG